jgi:hypothetical protein
MYLQRTILCMTCNQFTLCSIVFYTPFNVHCKYCVVQINECTLYVHYIVLIAKECTRCGIVFYTLVNVYCKYCAVNVNKCTLLHASQCTRYSMCYPRYKCTVYNMVHFPPADVHCIVLYVYRSK